MDQQHYFHRLRAHDEWANREVLAFFKQTAPPPRALKFFAHVLAAESLWLNRMKDEEQSLAVWPELSVADCEKLLEAVAVHGRDFLQNMSKAGLARMVVYKNTKGESWQNNVGDILTHVFMHSAYHRGQIAAAMREAGHEPAYTDFIHAVRSGFVAPGEFEEEQP